MTRAHEEEGSDVTKACNFAVDETLCCRFRSLPPSARATLYAHVRYVPGPLGMLLRIPLTLIALTHDTRA